MSNFNIGDYSRAVRSLTRPVRNKDKQAIKAAFPATKRIADAKKGFFGAQFDMKDFQALLYMLSEGEVMDLFYSAGKDAGRLGISVTKQRMKQRDPNYNRRRPVVNDRFIHARLKRQSTGRSIYRYVMDNLNYTVDEKSKVIVGFVGEDIHTPLTGSRGQNLTPLVEGLPSRVAKAPVNMNVMPSINYRPAGSKANHISRNFIKIMPRKRQHKKGRTPKRFKYPKGSLPMVPVFEPQPKPFLENWANKTLQIIFNHVLAQINDPSRRKMI